MATRPASNGPGLIWPFPTYSRHQFRRVDQGQDLQYPGTRKVPVYAIAPGKIVALGPDPNGFGQVYPGEVLDTPIDGHREIYYGHVFPDANLIGHHVTAGEQIATTGGLHSGGNAYADSNWMELGFWPPKFTNGPLMAAALHNPYAHGTSRHRKSSSNSSVPASSGGFFGPLDNTITSIMTLGPLLVLGAGLMLWGAARATGAKAKAAKTTQDITSTATQAAGAAALAA